MPPDPVGGEPPPARVALHEHVALRGRVRLDVRGTALAVRALGRFQVLALLAAAAAHLELWPRVRLKSIGTLEQGILYFSWELHTFKLLLGASKLLIFLLRPLAIEYVVGFQKSL